MEREFTAIIQHAEADLTLHTARMPLQLTTIEELNKMESRADIAAERLGHADVDVICYGCTSGSLIHGIEFAKEIVKKIQDKTRIPTVTTSEAVLAAIQHLKVKALNVVTPYTQDIDQKEVEFLEHAGSQVLSMVGLGIVDNLDIGRYNPPQLIPIAHDHFVPHPEGGLFISCTNLRTIDIIQSLEDQLQIPVFSSNTASFFGVLQALDLEYSTDSFGQLLKGPF